MAQKKGTGRTISHTARKRPGRHAKKPNRHKAQANGKRYRGQGR